MPGLIIADRASGMSIGNVTVTVEALSPRLPAAIEEYRPKAPCVEGILRKEFIVKQDLTCIIQIYGSVIV